MDNLVVNAVAPWQGYLHWVGNVKKGDGKNGEYAFADFTLKYTNSKMQEKFITFSASSIEAVALLERTEIGTPMKVQWFPDTAEDPQRDRWYPKFAAFNVSVIKDVQAPAPAPKAEKITAPNFPNQQDSHEAWKNPTKAEQVDYQADSSDLPF